MRIDVNISLYEKESIIHKIKYFGNIIERVNRYKSHLDPFFIFFKKNIKSKKLGKLQYNGLIIVRPRRVRARDEMVDIKGSTFKRKKKFIVC